MKISQPLRVPAKHVMAKPSMVRLQPKEVSMGDDTINPDFEQTSIFHSISEIKRMPTSGLSHQAVLEARNTVQNMIMCTEKVSDLIEDGKTTLVFKEHTIEASSQDVANHRFIVYQRPNSEGQIKIKSKSRASYDIEEEEDPFVFRQCTFFFCETKEKRDNTNAYLSVGIKIACEQKVVFIDCAFVGITFTAAGTKTTGVDFMVFTDCFSKLNLELDNCYFKGAKSVLYTNFPVKSLVMNQCTFDGIESDCMHITHPSKLQVNSCQFYHCSNLPLNIKLFDEDHTEKPAKRASGFATSTKIDNSVVA